MSLSNLPAFAVETEALTKVYAARGGQPSKRALDGISLAIPRGSFFGLLGPNGAGKSTLINILAGLVVPSGGHARIWGHDLRREERQARCAIGVVPQELNLDPFFTPRELLEVQAGMYGVPASRRRTDAILESVGLADKAHAYARTLSGGMRRRLLVAKAMVHAPPVLVLDEPTAGVDVELRHHLWTTVRDLNARGTTILLTTHYLEEAQELCDRIAIIDEGRVVAHDDKTALLRRLDSKILTISLERPLTALPSVLTPFLPQMVENGRKLVFRYKPSRPPVNAILAALREAGLAIADLSTEETTLEDLFLQLTGRTASP